MADNISNLVPFPNPTKTTLKGLKKNHNPTRIMTGDRTRAAKFWNIEKSAVTDLTDSRKPNILPVVKKT